MIGTIFDIKKFAVHDGPGIRSTVFLKGCHLNCIWCHNPEGISPKVNLWYFENKCIKCHKCIGSCQNNALSIQKEPLSHIKIDTEMCSNAGACVAVCPTGALCFDGRTISTQEIVEILMADQVFYEQSKGGITLSGGDPFYQSDFALDILKSCKNKALHTAIETCLYVHSDILEHFIPFVDLFIIDMKLYDTYEHQRYTGVRNESIKFNLHYLADRKVNLLVRIPLIPGITAKDENIKKIAAFVHSIRDDIKMELINYNVLAESKYRIMNKSYSLLHNMKSFTQSELNHFNQIIKNEGVHVLEEIHLD
ncbi:MAG: glycyl-radical enzyme activating protein [Firmicutes bacterium HGW-Firmicutes-3]|jgi:pyruvate formate lyase activating enzyme|nr:MAG: glycyl-radical enzyme activating protein [Firmicutes bacterium HGW-Firmicutes-3]